MEISIPVIHLDTCAPEVAQSFTTYLFEDENECIVAETFLKKYTDRIFERFFGVFRQGHLDKASEDEQPTVYGLCVWETIKDRRL